MKAIQAVTDTIYWVGSSDRRLDKFENMVPLENGVSYNSYLIIGDKTALLDTVEMSVSVDYLENVKKALNGRALDYLVLHHMEPDHGANIQAIALHYPGVKIVGNAKTFQFLEQFYGTDLRDRYHEVKNQDTLELGSHTLEFIFAPMVHWPEVMFSYEKSAEILFSADAFGTFGALSGNIFDDETDFEDMFLAEARRYYSNIVGKFGAPVQSALKKIAQLPIKMIAPLHGPILRGKIPLMLEKYNLWSSYTPEKQGVVLVYGSMYGNTASATNALAALLAKRGVTDIRVYDVSKTHASHLIAAVFKYSHLVFSCVTYNLGIYYPMDSLLHELGALQVQNRKYALVGNGTWAPAAGKLMGERLATMKNMEQIGETLEITSRLQGDDMPALEKLADEIAASVLEDK